MKTLFAAIIFSLLASSSGAWAAEETHQHQALSPAQQSYQQGMTEMHDRMMQGLKAQDADVAFAQGMIAHHQGAIAMAKTELQYGKDPAMRKLAEQIIAAQQPEIDRMQAWLKQQQP
ncbi:DUF305 domain-containing protein [Mixta tenebrionis]|uniref:DUF305 domain-containing protein n=1 Tax=Mixta tenebrionis TaxID=2562439 RepID=A0A506V6T0_9GAMM|nr:MULTISPECIES: DUF305 domain-containing protein [Mixta]QHM76428.1 hypothetical protein C7M52_02404 [Mixta theicola]TPW41387.1 DUF305 domain-containing protein [Mixta tenebrionis]